MIGHLNLILAAQVLHDQGLFLRRADIGAVPTAGAVQWADLHSVFEPLELFSLGVQGYKILRGFLKLFLRREHRSNDRVGANKGTLVALDAVFGDPFRHIDGHPAFFILGGRRRENAVGRQGAYRHLIALLEDHRGHDLGDKFGDNLMLIGRTAGLSPRFRHIDDLDRVQGLIHGADVHVDDLGTFFTIRFLDGILEEIDRLIRRNDVRDLEEGGLHDHVDPSAETDLFRDADCINVVKFQMPFRNDPSQSDRNLPFHFLDRPGRVQKKNTAVDNAVQKVELVDVGRDMTGDKIGVFDEIMRKDPIRRKTDVRNGHAA
ncbi:MAG: hypothetical protein A4E72_00130 [Syntrophus sp. PtaU1.Bin208]|nr:MAG: hypothetical protein A4E72_00130 [Syntrophus sp. PtaU1.Bin208]